MKLELDGIPPSLNKFAGRLNAWEYRDLKSSWGIRVKAAVGRQKPATPYPKAKVHITYNFPDRRRRDPDNYAGKMILDGLVRSGVIADDSFGCIQLVLSAKFGCEKGMTVVEVEPC